MFMTEDMDECSKSHEHEPLHSRINEIRQALTEATGLAARAQKLEDTYIQYIMFANAGGIAACLGIADALAGKENLSASAIFSGVKIPMWFFLIGLICSGLLLSLQRTQATSSAEQNALKAVNILKELGQIVPTSKPVYSRIERNALPHLNIAINFLGLVSQFCFAVGAVWGLLSMGSAR